MLYLDTSLELHGISIFRDYNDSNRYYYMPRSPHLTREAGQPLFQLLIYREDIAERAEFNAGDRDGGGFLTMTVDLSVSQGTLDTIKAELADRAGSEVDLVPVPFEKGSVRVTALGESTGAAPGIGGDTEEGEARQGSGFVEEILGSARSSLYGDNRAVFSIELSKRGALLMRASIEEGGASQIAIVYDLDYKGLMPARECSITINFKQSYTHLRSRAKINTLWFKADIDNEFEKLMKEGHIKIEDVDYLGLDADKQALRATELQNLAKELAQWNFFKPGLQPGTVLARDRGGELSVYDPTTAAAKVTAGFSTPLNLMVSGEGRTDDGPALVRGNTERTGGVRGSTGGEAPPAEQPSAESTTSQRREPTAVERWNQAGRPQAGYMMRSLSQEEQQTLTFNLRQVSAVKRTAAPQSSIRFAARDTQLAGRIKVVDLNDPFFDIISGTVTSTADLAAAGVRSMIVKIRYGERPDGTGPKDVKEFRIVNTGDSGTYQFHLDHKFQMNIEYQVVVHYKSGFAIGDDAPKMISPWITTSTRNLDIDPRILSTVFPVTLTVGQVDWNAAKSIQSTVEYIDTDAGITTNSNVVLNQQNPSTIVYIKPRVGGSRIFKVGSTYFYTDTQEGPVIQEGSDSSLIVLNEPPTKAVAIAMTLVDPMNRIHKAAVELVYTGVSGREQQKVVELRGEAASSTWTFFRDSMSDEAVYRYRVTYFQNDGTTSTTEWQNTAGRNLVLGDQFPGMLEVSIEVIGDLEAAGFVIGRLTMEYPDAPEGFDNRQQWTLRGTVANFSWKVPSSKRMPGPYKWEVEYIRRDRSVVREEGASEDEQFFLFVPA